MGVGLRARFHATTVRPLSRGAATRVRAVIDSDPVGTCMVAARFESAGMDRAALGGRFLGTDSRDGALCFVGANIIPLAGSPTSLGAVSRVLASGTRRCASIVGRAELVLPLWRGVQPSWGPARDVRADQPLLVCPDPPTVPVDPRLEVVSPSRIADYFPAAVAMFSEEVGTDPTSGDGGRGYRARVLEILAAGRAFAIFDGSTVIYKAEIGALSTRVALIQGVWVHPSWRGQGIAEPATAAVVQTVHRWGRLPSLYVNAHNVPARATYDRLGFGQVGTFASVLF